MLMQPHIHMLLLIGIALIWLAVVVQRGADTLRDSAIPPLQQADVHIRRDVNTVNDFLEQVPNDAVDELNDLLKEMLKVADYTALFLGLVDQSYNAFISRLNLVLNQFLSQVCCTD